MGSLRVGHNCSDAAAAQGLVPLHWGCALPSPIAPGKAPNHIHTTLRWGRAPGKPSLAGAFWEESDTTERLQFTSLQGTLDTVLSATDTEMSSSQFCPEDQNLIEQMN